MKSSEKKAFEIFSSSLPNRVAEYVLKIYTYEGGKVPNIITFQKEEITLKKLMRRFFLGNKELPISIYKRGEFLNLVLYDGLINK